MAKQQTVEIEQVGKEEHETEKRKRKAKKPKSEKEETQNETEKPEKKKKREGKMKEQKVDKKKIETEKESSRVELLVSKLLLTEIYEKFGRALDEERTEMFYTNFCGCVTFLNIADGEKVFESSQEKCPFTDTSTVKFRLKYPNERAGEKKAGAEVAETTIVGMEDLMKQLEEAEEEDKAGLTALVEYNEKKIFEVVRVIWDGIMDAVQWSGKNQQQNSISVLRQVKIWAPLLNTFCSNGKTEMELMYKVQIQCYWCRKGSNPKCRQTFVKGLEPFVNWLKKVRQKQDREKSEQRLEIAEEDLSKIEKEAGKLKNELETVKEEKKQSLRGVSVFLYSVVQMNRVRIDVTLVFLDSSALLPVSDGTKKLLLSMPRSSPKRISEYEIIEIGENVCNLKNEEAVWMLKIDIVEKGDKLQPVEQEEEGMCNSEYKAIETACQKIIGYSDKNIAEYEFELKGDIVGISSKKRASRQEKSYVT